MKTLEDILEYIDRWIACAIERPEMYAGTPQELEHSVCLFEDLRCFILEQDPLENLTCTALDKDPSIPSRSVNSYTTYLVAKGYGSRDFSGTKPDCRFDDVAEFVRKYLISQKRPLMDH